MSNYTPTTETVRIYYGYARVPNDLQTDREYARLRSEHEAEFDRWIQRIKEDAWDQGFMAADNPIAENPHATWMKDWGNKE